MIRLLALAAVVAYAAAAKVAIRTQYPPGMCPSGTGTYMPGTDMPHPVAQRIGCTPDGTGFYMQYMCMDSGSGDFIMVQKFPTADCSGTGDFVTEFATGTCDPDNAKWTCRDTAADCSSGATSKITLRQYHDTTMYSSGYTGTSGASCEGRKPTHIQSLDSGVCYSFSDEDDAEQTATRFECDGSGFVRQMYYKQGDCSGPPEHISRTPADTCMMAGPGVSTVLSCACDDLEFTDTGYPSLGGDLDDYAFAWEVFSDSSCSPGSFKYGRYTHKNVPVEEDGGHAYYSCYANPTSSAMPALPGRRDGGGSVHLLNSACEWNEENQAWVKASCQTKEVNRCTMAGAGADDIGIVLTYRKHCLGGSAAFYAAKYNLCNGEIRTKTHYDSSTGTSSTTTELSSWKVHRDGDGSERVIIDQYEGSLYCEGPVRPGSFNRNQCKRMHEYSSGGGDDSSSSDDAGHHGDGDDDEFFILASSSCVVPEGDDFGWYPSKPDCSVQLPPASFHPDGGYVTTYPSLAQDGPHPSPVHTTDDGTNYFALRHDLIGKLRIAPWAHQCYHHSEHHSGHPYSGSDSSDSGTESV